MTVTAYHGSFSEPFESFEPQFSGKGSGVKSGYYFFTSNKENAIEFADSDVGHLVVAKLHLNNPFVVKQMSNQSPREIANDVTMSNYENDTDYDAVIIESCVDSYCGLESTIYVVFESESIEIIDRVRLG